MEAIIRRVSHFRILFNYLSPSELVNLSCGPDPALNQACKGALFEIYSSKLPEELTTDKTSTASQTPSTPTEKPSQHIMISYRWEQPSKSVMSEIKDQLRSRGYNVWMDEDFMSKPYNHLSKTLAQNWTGFDSFARSRSLSTPPFL